MKSGLRRALRPRNAVPIPVGTSSGYMALPGLATGASERETYLRTYGTVGTVFSIVSLYASSTARPAWQMFEIEQQDKNRYTTRDEGSDQRQQVFGNPALTLLNKPNPFMTGFELRELSQTYLELTGESYWVVERNELSSMPIGLWPARPDRMQPVTDPEDYLKGYVYTSPDGREKVPLTVDEVIVVKYPNPLDPTRGLGPVQAVLVDIDAARYASEWNRNWFINSAEPGGIIQSDDELNDADWQRLMDRWREQHRGVARAHRVAVLEGGLKWIPNSHSAKDMDFANLRDQERDILREAWRMHKVMVGVSDDVNRANAQTGEEIFSSWGVVPRLDRWKDALNAQYLPLFGSVTAGRELDYITPVPANREQDNAELLAKSQAALFLSQAGFEKSQIPRVVGLPDMDAAPVQPAPVPIAPPQQQSGGDQGDGSQPANHLDGWTLARIASAPYNQLTGAPR
jgi:HK97 family phage portal protein